MDLGVAADFIGNFFGIPWTRFLDEVRKSSVHTCGDAWWRCMTGTSVIPDSLKLTKFTRTSDAAAKLSWNEVARHLAEEMLSNVDVLESTVKSATCHVASCCGCFFTEAPCANILARHSRRFATLYVALADSSPSFFKDKPKLHMMQELCEMQLPSKPVLTC